MTIRKRPLALVGTLFGVLFLATLDNQLLIPLVPNLRREFAVSMQTLGWLFSGYALAAATFSLLVGPLTDRLGRAHFLRFGIILFFLVAISTYFVKDFSYLFGLRLAAGWAAGLLSTCTASFVGDHFPYAQRGRVMGVVLGSYFVALMVGIPLAALVAELWNWRAVFLFSSLLSLFLLIGTFLFVPTREGAAKVSAGESSWSVYPRLLAKRETLAAVAVSFGVSGATLSFLTFISDYLNQAFGLGPVQISWLFLAAGGAAALASPTAGWLSDRFTKRSIFLVSNTLLAAPLLLLPRVPWGGWLLVVVFLISLCVGFRQAALQTLQTELIATEQRGSYLALRNAFSQMGISFSVLVSGALYSKWGYGGVTSWAVVLTLLGSLILYLAVPEPNQKQ